MKLVYFRLGICSVLTANAQTNASFANRVPIGNSGFYLVFKGAMDIDSTNAETQVSADAPLYWILENTTSNRFATISFLGMEHAFSFKAFDPQGREVPLTPYGKRMNAGPDATNSLYNSHRIGPGIRDFPKLETLFEFPKARTYIFEIRYWFWDYLDESNKHFRLTETVRLRLVKRDD
jgi:hypothetical protein